MRVVRISCALAALSLIACGSSGDDGGDGDGDGGNNTGGGGDYVTVSSISPAHGPLPGGNSVIVTGSGFARVNASPNMLLVGGRIALSVAVLTDTEIEVVMPAGMDASAVDLTLFNNNGTVTLADAYNYNPLPTVTGLDPDNGDVGGGVTVVVTGTGFEALEAGSNRVWIGGSEATLMSVDSDTQLTVVSPAGSVPGEEATVTVSNDNGPASHESFRYTSADLVTFGHNVDQEPNSGETILVDPSSASTSSLRPSFLGNLRISSVARGSKGVFIATRQRDVGLLHDDGTWEVLGPIVNCSQSISAMAMHKGTLYATCHFNPDAERFGQIDTLTGVYTPIGGLVADVASFPNLVSDGTTLYIIDGNGVSTIDPATGTISNTKADTIGLPRGAAFLGGVLYVISRGLSGESGPHAPYTLHTLVPSTGLSTSVGVIPFDVHGLYAAN